MGEDTQGKLIRRTRKQRGMTQGDLAEVIDVSQPTVSAWELDRWNVPRSKQAHLARILGVERKTLTDAINRTEFEDLDILIVDEANSAKTDVSAATFQELKQELDRTRSLNDQLAVYLERVATLEPRLERLLERLEKTAPPA